jgi:hypothetical protein
VADALRRSIDVICELGREGGAADELPKVLDELAAQLDATARDIDRHELTSLRPLSSMMVRVVRSFALESCSPPALTVTVRPEWVGYPVDVERGSVVVDVSFPGPGCASNVSLWLSWADEPEVHFGAVALAQLTPQDTQCISLPAGRPGSRIPGDAAATVTVQYDWAFMNKIQRQLLLTVPIGDFVEFLAARRIDTQEFPDPFVVDKPLSRDEVQTDLFQGRKREIDEVRRTFGTNQFPAAPLCFYGIRRTEKTSLLRRIATELDSMRFAPVEVSLNGIVRRAADPGSGADVVLLLDRAGEGLASAPSFVRLRPIAGVPE